MSNPAAGVVCDAGPLIHLDELDGLWLLDGFEPLLVPGQVWHEVALHRSTLHIRPKLLQEIIENML